MIYPETKPVVSTTKGTEIMDAMMMSQYENKPLLRQYFLAFIEEMDLLFKDLEDCYLGRFLQHAVGAQLDIIGIILDEPRSIDIPTQFFGFSDDGIVPPNVAPLADAATPSDGGIFRSAEQKNTESTGLSDVVYRRVLAAKAWVIAQDTINTNTIYDVVTGLLGKTPRVLRLQSESSLVDVYTNIQVYSEDFDSVGYSITSGSLEPSFPTEVVDGVSLQRLTVLDNANLNNGLKMETQLNFDTETGYTVSGVVDINGAAGLSIVSKNSSGTWSGGTINMDGTMDPSTSTTWELIGWEVLSTNLRRFHLYISWNGSASHSYMDMHPSVKNSSSASVGETMLVSQIQIVEGSRILPYVQTLASPVLVDPTLSPRQLVLEVSAADTSLGDSALISYFSQYFIPLGTIFTVTRI